MATFWKDTADFLLTGMGTDLFAKSTNLITHIAPLFSAGFGIYFMIVILNAYNRGLDGNTIDFAKKTVAWLIIIACAFNAGQYNKIANMAYEFPEWLGGIFGNGSVDASALDAAWDSIMLAVEKMMVTASELDVLQVPDKIAMWMGAGLLIILGGLFFGIVLAYYLVAKLSLAMIILIGPLFLGMMLFSSTRQYAMNWFGQIFNYGVTVAFFTILTGFQMQFFNNHIQNTLTDTPFETAMQIFAVFPIFLTATMIFIIVALNIPSIASALTGGAGAGGFSNMVQFVRQALNGGKQSNPLTGVGARKAYGQGRAFIGKVGQFMGRGNSIGNGRR